MINVLQRLAELDSQNPNVATAKPATTGDAAVEAVQKTLSEELSVESLRYLSGVKQTLEECGMYPESMGMMAPHQPSTPASFSINATAADGDEVANMLSQILTLAGGGKVGQEHMPIDKPAQVMSTTPTLGQSGNDDMKRMIDLMNEPKDEAANPDDEDNYRNFGSDYDGGNEDPHGWDDVEDKDEGVLGTLGGAALGAMAGGPMGAAIGGVAGDELTGDEQEDEGTGEIPEVDIAGVGGGLAAAAMHDGDEEEIAKGVEAGKDFTDGSENEELEAKSHIRKMMDMLDNTPNRPTNVPHQQVDKFNYEPNGGGAGIGDRMDGNMPKGNMTAEDSMASKLFNDYQKFVTEGKKCCCKDKGESKCPVHGKMEEGSGLQYYTGVKKHGAKYMKDAAKLMRDGGTQKELGALRDKESKAYKNK